MVISGELVQIVDFHFGSDSYPDRQVLIFTQCQMVIGYHYIGGNTLSQQRTVSVLNIRKVSRHPMLQEK